MASQLLEQQEKLRRVVDEWRFRSHDLLSNLRGDPFACPPPAAAPSTSASSDPVRLHVEPLEHSDLSALLESDNVAVSKLVMVLSYDCIEISRLHRSVRPLPFLFPIAIQENDFCTLISYIRCDFSSGL